MCWCMGLFFPRCRAWHFYLLNCMRFLLGPFSSLLTSFRMAAQQPEVSTNSPNFVLSENLLKLRSFPSLMGHFIKMLNCIVFGIDFKWLPPTELWCHWRQSCEPSSSVSFQSASLSIYIFPNSSGFVSLFSWEDVMGDSVKALLNLS